MQYIKKLILIVIVIAVILLIYINIQSTPMRTIDARYKDASLSIDERVENLLSQMTLEEKAGQMALIEKGSIDTIQDVSQYGIGGLLSGGGGNPKNNTPTGWQEMVGTFVKESRKSDLGIPLLYGVDAIHGQGNMMGATIFPHAIGLGASRDADLVERIAKATAEEVKATTISWIYSPNLDIPEDTRWGRVYEAFSSDPDVVSLLGAAYTRGLVDSNIIATAKHYIGVGSMKWGSSSSKDYKIDQGSTPVDEKALRSQYLPPFKAVIDAGAQSVMVGLNTWGGRKLATNTYLITDVLKGELGFKGFVVSDWYGVYEIPGGDYANAVTAINAGIDMTMLPYDYKPFIQDVVKATKKGDISEERINDAVRRILRAKFEIGLFDDMIKSDLNVIGSAKHRALAREAVSKSLVLLKNHNAVLPLTSTDNKIFVAGSSAHNTGRQSGGWTIEWQGVEGNVVLGATSILDGIKEVAGSGTEVVYDQNADFTLNAGIADVGIAVVGEKPYAEGWGDNAKPELLLEDLQTIEKLKKVSKKVIVIIVSGRPLLLPDVSTKWDGIIAVWLPGGEGAGIADVLFGKKTFTGKLPIAWPPYSFGFGLK